MSDKDGGPAFPIPDERGPNGEGIMQGSSGMSLRDYFAGRALETIIGKYGYDDMLAKRAYAIADSMIRARGDAS